MIKIILIFCIFLPFISFTEQYIPYGKPNLNAIVNLEIITGGSHNYNCTAFFIGKHHLLTAEHCIDNEQQKYLEIYNKHGELITNEVKVIASNKDYDIALLSIPNHLTQNKPLLMGDESLPYFEKMLIYKDSELDFRNLKVLEQYECFL